MIPNKEKNSIPAEKQRSDDKEPLYKQEIAEGTTVQEKQNSV